MLRNAATEPPSLCASTSPSPRRSPEIIGRNGAFSGITILRYFLLQIAFRTPSHFFQFVCVFCYWKGVRGGSEDEERGQMDVCVKYIQHCQFFSSTSMKHAFRVFVRVDVFFIFRKSLSVCEVENATVCADYQCPYFPSSLY